MSAGASGGLCLPGRGLRGWNLPTASPELWAAAVCMNAGAYGGEMKQVVTAVTALFPEEGIRTLTAEETGLRLSPQLLL